MQKIVRRVGTGWVTTLMMGLMTLPAAATTLPATYKFAPNAAVDTLFAKFDSTTSPGCSAAAAKDGKLVYSRGYGMANLDHGVANTPQTPFHVASVSKQFTAASIVLLAQEGKLSLDDDVRKYLPEVPDLGTTITLRQMIHHTSGLRDQWDLLEMAGWKYSQDLISDDDVLRLMSKQRKLNFAPNSQYLYSNMGYTLLALVVKRVSGQSLREFTTERIFQPLGMSNTHFRDDHAEIVPGFANGYERAGDSFRTSVTNFNTTGATSLLATAEDLLRWDENFYTGQVGGKAFTGQMEQRAVLNDGEQLAYASGIAHETYRGLAAIGHSGSDAGYRAHVLRFPVQHFGVAVVCNIAEARPADLGKGIADVYLAAELQPKPAKEAVKSVKVSARSLRDKAGIYLDRVEGSVLRLEEKDGRLQAVDFYGETRPLIALAATRFRLEPFDVELEFAGDTKQSDLVSRPKDGKPKHWSRVPSFEPTAAQLDEYLGSFASEELDVRYYMQIKDGVLHAASLRRNPQPMKPITQDVFTNEQGMLLFTRDAAGRIDGFALTGNRARDIRFDKSAEPNPAH